MGDANDNPPSPPPSIEEVDPDGDLTLVVGPLTTRTDFRVCSRAMARASPVWKILLGNFSEVQRGRDGKPWEVELPDDSVNALRILLHIIHGKFGPVPTTTMTRDLLYDICILTDKYDMTEAVKPYAQTWFDNTYIRNPERDLDIVQQLWITFEMGHEEGFKLTFTNLILHAKVSGDNNRGLIGSSNDLVYNEFDTMLRIGVLETVKSVREDCLSSQLKSLNWMYDCLRGVKKYFIQDDTLCRLLQNEDSPRCDNERLGSFIRILSRSSFWPPPIAKKATDSPASVYSMLNAATNDANRSLKLNGHYECKIPQVPQGGRGALEDKCRENVPEDVTKHLVEQRKKTGLREPVAKAS